MSKSYSQVMKQIQNLQREAEDLRRKEIQGVVERIKEAIKAYNLSASDLGLGAAKRGRVSAARKAAPKAHKSKSRAPKYRDENGNTWVGRGKRPGWLRDALAAGRNLSDFAIR